MWGDALSQPPVAVRTDAQRRRDCHRIGACNLHDICLAGNIRQRLVEPFRNMQPLALMQCEKEGDNGGLLSHHAF